ncbi:hypothetical protein PPHE_b0102 [Pseudoalteromonas phenolica O-BC30]|nr:hypothetical protein [Pseudoalteromonas phenolica O-BC30]
MINHNTTISFFCIVFKLFWSALLITEYLQAFELFHNS